MTANPTPRRPLVSINPDAALKGETAAASSPSSHTPYRGCTPNTCTACSSTNNLFEERYQAGGRPVAVGDIRASIFMVATVRDHAARGARSTSPTSWPTPS